MHLFQAREQYKHRSGVSIEALKSVKYGCQDEVRREDKANIVEVWDQIIRF